MKLRRGFAVMDKDRLRQIASKGGKKAHQIGTAFEWDADAARAAGRKGGQWSRTKARKEKADAPVDE